MKSKIIIWRIVIEIIVVLSCFSALEMMTEPSASTIAAVQEAVNKKHLEPICMVEVRSAARSASYVQSVIITILIAGVALLCSDGWALWQLRRTNQSYAPSA